MNDLIKRYNHITSDQASVTITLSREQQALLLALDDRGIVAIDDRQKLDVFNSIIRDIKIELRG